MHCWSHSAQEAGRYLESYKLYERKPPDLIRERVDDSYMAHMTSALTSVRGVNKTDVTTLVSNFGVRRRSTSPFLGLFSWWWRRSLRGMVC